MSDTYHIETETISDIVTIAQNAATPVEVQPGKRYALGLPEGAKLHELNLDLDEFRDHPRRKKGTVAVHDAASFADYFHRHYETNVSEVWADVLAQHITGILNGHETGAGQSAGWRDHRVRFTVTPTDAWKAWLGIDGKMLPQREFAEFLEDNVLDIRQPTSADMLEVAQTIEGNVGVEFESGERLSTGQRRFAYRETTTAKAGQSGTLEVPETIKLALRPFEGAALFEVTARFRYRINGGNLSLGVKLDRPKDVLTDAFEDVVVRLGEALPDDASIQRGAAPS